MGDMADYYSDPINICELYDQYDGEDVYTNSRNNGRRIHGSNTKTRRKVMKNKVIIPKNKFYLADRRVITQNDSGYCKATVDEAVEDAKERCEETGEIQAVVQIVRIIYPQRAPLVVKKI